MTTTDHRIYERVQGCDLIVLANDLDVTLVTTDRQLLGAFPEVAVPLTDFDPARPT